MSSLDWLVNAHSREAVAAARRVRTPAITARFDQDLPDLRARVRSICDTEAERRAFIRGAEQAILSVSDVPPAVRLDHHRFGRYIVEVLDGFAQAADDDTVLEEGAL